MKKKKYSRLPDRLNLILEIITDNANAISIINKITINPSVDYNKWLKRFDTQLIEPTNQNSIKVTKVGEPTKKKTLL